jgi:drug/metabolite transporter (DMT)-like permease
VVWNVVAAFFFAAMGALAHHVGPRCGWRAVMLGRGGLGFVLALGLAWSGGARMYFWGPRALWVRSVAGAIVQACTFFALQTLPATDVVTLRNTSPIWIAAMAGLAGWARPGGRAWVAVVGGVVGVVLLERPRLMAFDLPLAAALGSSWLVGVAMLALSRLGEVDPRAIAVHLFGVTSVGAVLAFWTAPGEFTRVLAMPWEVHGWLVLVGIAGCLAQLAMARAYGLGAPVGLAVAGLTQVVFAALFDLAAGARALGLAEVAGIAVILGAGASLTPRRQEVGPAPEESV